jgi:hypothetical protein
MSDNTGEGKSVRDQLVDLVVFAPAGLALTVVEDLPKLVDKGRDRVSRQVDTARLVGQIAVQMGRRMGRERLEHLGERVAGGVSGVLEQRSRGRGPHLPGVPRPFQAQGKVKEEAGTSSTASSGDGPDRRAPGPPERAPSARPPSTSAQAATSAPRVSGDVPAGATEGSLAIPGYDSLSASQVVGRLGGLDRGELQEVRSHELANRRRRTVLNRVDQLLAGAEGPEPA